jgi:hypothetical protein
VAPTKAPCAKPSAQPSTEPIVETQAVPPMKGITAFNARSRKKPEKYVPSMAGNKYVGALTQKAALLKGSKHAMSMAQILAKLI